MRRVPDEVLAELRTLTVEEVLRRLGVYWTLDREYRPIKTQLYRRVWVTTPAGEVVGLQVDGIRWYDLQARKGGGGGIDLAMHLLGCSFREAVRLLRT